MEIKITSGNLKIISDDLNEKLKFNHISNVTMVNSHDFLFSFSLYRKGKLFVSLNHQSPFVSLVSEVVNTSTIVGSLNDTLRKLVKDGTINEIKTINNDRILAISYTKVDDLYEKVNRTLVFELIPHRQNLIIIEEGKVIFASHYAGLDSSRPLVKGMNYQPLENKTIVADGKIDLKELQKEAEEYYLASKQERNLEKYKALIVHIKSRIKSLRGKILVLNKASEKAKNELAYQDVGNMILAYAYEKEELENYLKDNNVDYDRSLTPGMNAEKYFKKYKKAKRTIEMNDIEIEKTNNEIDNLTLTLAQIPYLKEEDLLELSMTLFPHKFKMGNKKVTPSTYGTVIVYNTKIHFGKNAKQNDELTFKKGKKAHYFFHIKDTHGSHVLVESDNPSKEVILAAAEIAILMSGKEDGEVQYTQIKNIKKGSYLGQALLTSYETVYIKNIRDLTKKLIINC